MLEQERDYYDQHVAEWLRLHPGRFVLVKGSELVGTFDTIKEALAEGARRYGLTSYLIRRVEPTPPAIQIPALSLGLLHADSARSVRGSGRRAGR